MNLKEIEDKLNKFNDKLNDIGSQVSDVLNSGVNSFDSTLNGCVESIDKKVNEFAEKYDEKRVENKECETSIPNMNSEVEGLGSQDSISVTDIIKPSIPVDLNKKENNDSVSNEDINQGVKVNLEKSENIENLGEEIV